MKKFLKKARDQFLSPIAGRMEQLEQKLHGLDHKMEHLEQDLYLFRDSTAEGLVRRLESIQEKEQNLEDRIFQQKMQILLQAGLHSENGDSLFESYSNLMNHSEEYRLFNDIPVEYYCELVQQDKNPLFVGNYADLCVQQLGAGDAFRPVTGFMAQPAPAGAFLCSPALLPDYMGERDSVVITSPPLAQLLLNDRDLCDRWKDHIGDRLIFPVMMMIPEMMVRWDSGFSHIEQNGEHFMRWAVDFDKPSEISILDFSGASVGRMVTVSFDTYAAHNQGELIVQAFGSETKIDLSGGIHHVELQGKISSAKESLVFCFKGLNQMVDLDVRELKFTVMDLQITIESLLPITGKQAYGLTATNYEGFDQYIRRVLHLSGFFEVQAEICANRGFYRHPAGRSEFLLGDEFYFEPEKSDVIFEYATTSHRKMIPMLYCAYRKQQKGGLPQDE